MSETTTRKARHRPAVRAPRSQAKPTPEILAGAMGRLTEASRRVVGEPDAVVRTSDLRIVLAAYAASHQAGRVAAGASPETFEQVLARYAAVSA